MFEHIEFQPISCADGELTIRALSPGSKYERWSAARYADEPARLTRRQANFYENLIQMALLLQADSLPVDFTAMDRGRMYLDHGCIKMAEHANFIRPLTNDPSGYVARLHLSWLVIPRR